MKTNNIIFAIFFFTSIPQSFAQEAYLTPRGIVFVQNNGVIITPDGPIIPIYRPIDQQRNISTPANLADPVDKDAALKAAFSAMDEEAKKLGEQKPKRSKAIRADFQRAHPCPATGNQRGACPGYVIDHINPLCAGGSDDLVNMQWQSVSDAKAKDREENKLCRKMRSVAR